MEDLQLYLIDSQLQWMHLHLLFLNSKGG